jgi:ABC-type oligopeptide transport system ATPase subunit
MSFIDNFLFGFNRKKVFALVGGSGTGKSFRAKLVAQKYGIDFIIDDGLLDKG